MNELFSPDIKKIHLIGIGGSSMVTVAELLLDRGYELTGSDMARNVNVIRLEKKGIPISIGHFPKSVRGADLIIHTSFLQINTSTLLLLAEPMERVQQPPWFLP